jgi:hypothetical protein
MNDPIDVFPRRPPESRETILKRQEIFDKFMEKYKGKFPNLLLINHLTESKPDARIGTYTPFSKHTKDKSND